MILNSDIYLTHPLWERADIELKDQIKVFDRLIDIYIIACAIGIKEDKVLDVDEPTLNPKTIGRNTFGSQSNSDLMESLTFFSLGV